MITATVIAVLAAVVGAYLIGRHRAVRSTLAWKRGHAVGRRAGLRERDELTAKLVRLRGELADLKATGRELISAIHRHAPAEVNNHERSAL